MKQYKKGDTFVIKIGEPVNGRYPVIGTGKWLTRYQLDNLVQVEKRELDMIGLKSSRKIYREVIK